MSLQNRAKPKSNPCHSGECSTTDAYLNAIRKRPVWLEPLFAEAKEWRGLQRLDVRGPMNANIEGLLIVVCQI